MGAEELDELLSQAGISRYKLSQLLGMSQPAVQQWFSRGSVPAKHLLRISKVTGIDIKHFPLASMKAVNSNDSVDAYVMIPKLSHVSASAGGGEMIDSIDLFEEKEKIPIMPSDIPSSSNPDNLRAVKVDGKSMLPTLMPGSWVIFDTSVKHYNGDGLYVVSYAGALFVKRLQFDPSISSIEIISDNPQYKDYKVSLVENQQPLIIMGEVVVKVER